MKVAPYLLARVLLCVRPGVPVRVTCRVAWKGTSRRVLLCVGLHQGSQIEFISFLLCPLPHSPLPKKHRANTPLGDAMCVSSNCTLVYTRAHGARSTSSHTGKHKSPRSEVLYWAARAGNQKHLCQYTLRRAVGTLVCPISMVPLWVGGAPQGFFPGVHPIRMQVVSWGVPLTASLLLGLCS